MDLNFQIFTEGQTLKKLLRPALNTLSQIPVQYQDKQLQLKVSLLLIVFIRWLK